MSTTDGRYTMVYNGEITNYLELREVLIAEGIGFDSDSDTEVLLAAWAHWGAACLERLEGMYAFAVLDHEAQTLTLCRDPFGIKPLYFRHIPHEGIAFGSELSSILPLLPDQPKLDWASAVAYLASGSYDDSERSFVEGVRQLAPGGSIVVDLQSGQVSVERLMLWRPSIATDESVTSAQAVDGVRTLLLDSVRRNLQSDVPVGVALSGGIDSTAIAGAVRHLEPDYPLQLFSFISSDEATSESTWIELANAQLQAPAWSVTPTAADLAADLDDLILAQGEPFGSTSIYAQYRVFRLMHETGIVVSLDGQGGDEVFAGYHGYVGQRVRSLLERGQVGAAATFLRNWGQWPGRSAVKGGLRAGAEFAPSALVSAAYRQVPGALPTGVKRDVLKARGLDWTWPSLEATNDGIKGVRVKAELRAALTERGLQSLLRHGDRNSMRFSVESRVPFLDRALVDFVLSLPEQLLVDERGTSKAILRSAMRGLVPDAILDRRDKIGFETPDAQWIDSQRTVFAMLIAQAPEIGFLDKRQILAGVDPATFAGSSKVKPIGSRLTWRLFNLYRWAALLDVSCQA